jgi:prephenate dehydrogenase
MARTAAAIGDASRRWVVTSSVPDAVAEADTVVVAVPFPVVGTVLDAVAATGFTGILTDVTPVKTPAAALARRRCPNARWVGGHPMAGTERSGFAASDPALFDGAAWVLALDADTELADWLSLAALYTGIGARVVPARAAEHDTAVARISHLPHLVAAALTEGAADPLALSLAAGSFRDGTRVAATRPELTAGMCGTNAEALLAELDAVVDRLERLRGALDAPDPAAALVPELASAHRIRAGWPPRPGTPTRLPAEAGALLDLGRAGGWVTAVSDDGRSVTAVRPEIP